MITAACQGSGGGRRLPPRRAFNTGDESCRALPRDLLWLEEFLAPHLAGVPMLWGNPVEVPFGGPHGPFEGLGIEIRSLQCGQAALAVACHVSSAHRLS